MKALRTTLVSIAAAVLASATLAGPAPRYSKTRSAVPPPPAEKAAAKVEKESCKTMSVTHGRFTRIVKCDPATVPGCKTHCEK